MPLPTDSTHLSDFDTADMIDQFGGIVDSQFAKTSMMRKFVNVRPVRGTDTLINRRVGKTTLQSLTPGVRPDATPTQFGKVSVTVDTVIIARDNRSMLNEFQTDFAAKKEIGVDHGKEQGKFFDQAFLIQAAKGAYLPAPTNLNGAVGAGKNRTLAAIGDETDPDQVAKYIKEILIEMQEEDIETRECVVFVRPTIHGVLSENNKLVDDDFSEDNGDYALGKVKTIHGSAILPTARMPNAAITGHKLSNVANGNAYDVSALEANAIAIIMHPDSLIAGETIPLQSDVFWSREEKQWFIDSYTAFGVSNRRPDVCGVVRKKTV